MRAVDTNVVVRYLLNDEPAQARAAKAAVDGGPAFVATTVLLEVEWVLRSVYGMRPGAVAGALRGFIGLPTVRLENPAVAAAALDWCEAGLDSADALHLAAAQHCDVFLTFDRDLAKKAAGLGGTPVERL